MILFAVTLGTVRWFSRFIIFNIGRDIEYDLRNDLFEHLTTLGTDFYMKIKTGDLMSRMINDLTAVRMLVGMFVLSVSNTPLMYCLALGFMSSLNRRLTLFAVVPYLVLFVAIRWLMRKMMMRSLKVQEGLAAIGSKVQESLAGIPRRESVHARGARGGAVPQNQRRLQRAGSRTGAHPRRDDADDPLRGGNRDDDRADLRRLARDQRQDVARLAGGVSELPRNARDANDPAWLDAVDISARQSLDEAAR